jgi:TolB-like protein/Tfp pilus assembly protein PilF
LSAAHTARIIHRDIKPENIIVRNDGYVKVVDFGLAKLMPAQPAVIGLENETIRQDHTAEGTIVGTVSYMSPEQARGEKVDERTDIFSLGVVMYEMLTGTTPFAAASTTDILANLINKDPLRLSQYIDVPDELQRIVSKMLRKDPDERYQTMKGLLADLRELRDGLAIVSKYGRASVPDGERSTAVLPATTGDIGRTTTEKDMARPAWYRRPIVLAAVPVVLLAIVAFAWYWRQTAAGSQPQIRSLAVLPLRSLDSQEDILGLGIADAVIRRVSQTGKLTVRPTSSVRRYLTEETDALTAAKQLSADAILEGTVQRAGDRLRVSVNLLRTSDGASLWAESFDTQASDIFGIQDTVSQQVASRLQLQLDPAQQARLGKRSTSDPIAYEYYVKGVNSLDQRGFGPKAKPQIDATIDLFKKAVEADPNYALARAQLAFSYIWKALFNAPDEQASLADLAKEQLNRADTIDPQLAELHVARSWFLFSGYEGYQLEGAAHELLIAQQLNPNVGHMDLASAYYHMGLEGPAEREYLKALEIDPTSEFLKNQFAYFYYYMARWDDYFAACQKYLPEEDLDPFYLIAKGRIAEAEKNIEEWAVKEPDSPYVPVNRAMLFAAKGEHAKAEEQNQIFIRSLDKRVPSYHHDVYAVATVYSMIGKTDEAMKWLRESAATGFSAYPAFERDRFLDRIRQTPEFIKFMSEMKQLYDRRRAEFIGS